MATLEAINIQAEAQVKRIERLYREITGRDVTPMRRVHKDRDMLRLEQLTTIADWMEHMQPQSGEAVQDDTLTQAQEAARNGATKADIISILLRDDHDDTDNQ